MTQLYDYLFKSCYSGGGIRRDREYPESAQLKREGSVAQHLDRHINDVEMM